MLFWGLSLPFILTANLDVLGLENQIVYSFGKSTAIRIKFDMKCNVDVTAAKCGVFYLFPVKPLGASPLSFDEHVGDFLAIASWFEEPVDYLYDLLVLWSIVR